MLHLRLSDLAHLDRVRNFLAAVHVQVHSVEGLELLVSVPGAASPLHEQREIAAYVITYNALNPGFGLELVEEPAL